MNNAERRSDNWIEWAGGDCPVSEETRVEVRGERGWLVKAEAHLIRWNKVTAYRVVTP